MREIVVQEHGSYSPWKYWIPDYEMVGIGHTIERLEVTYVVVMVHWRPKDGGGLVPTFIVQRADQLMGRGHG